MSGPHPIRRLISGLILTLALGACSSGSGEATLNAQVAAAIRGIANDRFGAKPAPPVITRAVLDTLEGSFMEAALESRGNPPAYMFVAARLRDDRPGEIVVWRTEDNITLSLRNGVLIATRGLGDDLLSSDVAIRAGAPGPAGSGARRWQILALDNKAVNLSGACELRDLGPETIEIVGARHPTRHLQERCEVAGPDGRPGGSIVNDYWIDSRRGLVWQSRQWVSPEVGYLRLRRLTDG